MATRILFFGRLRDCAGGQERIVELPETVTDANSLIHWLCKDNELLGRALIEPDIRLCVDKEIAQSDAKISGAKEIAFLPPYSGG